MQNLQMKVEPNTPILACPHLPAILKKTRNSMKLNREKRGTNAKVVIRKKQVMDNLAKEEFHLLGKSPRRGTSTWMKYDPEQPLEGMPKKFTGGPGVIASSSALKMET